MNKQNIIKLIVSDINTKYKGNKKKRNTELNKVLRFVKNCDYFKGQRKKIYRVILDSRRI